MKLHGFGQRISSALEFREWTQGQLSLRSGVGQSHISQILRERKMPRLDIAAALARALDVSLDWLAGLPERHPEALAPDEAELLRLYRQLNKTDRGIVIGLARNMTERSR